MALHEQPRPATRRTRVTPFKVVEAGASALLLAACGSGGLPGTGADSSPSRPSPVSASIDIRPGASITPRTEAAKPSVTPTIDTGTPAPVVADCAHPTADAQRGGTYEQTAPGNPQPPFTIKADAAHPSVAMSANESPNGTLEFQTATGKKVTITGSRSSRWFVEAQGPITFRQTPDKMFTICPQDPQGEKQSRIADFKQKPGVTKVDVYTVAPNGSVTQQKNS